MAGVGLVSNLILTGLDEVGAGVAALPQAANSTDKATSILIKIILRISLSFGKLFKHTPALIRLKPHGAREGHRGHEELNLVYSPALPPHARGTGVQRTHDLL